MAIDFDDKDWQAVRHNADKWWRLELGRPLMQIRVRNDKKLPAPALPLYDFMSFYDLDVPSEKIIDRYDHKLSTTRYLGDAFPQFWPNFGPGVIATTLGAQLQNGVETVWFHPAEETDISDLRLVLNHQDIWFERILDISRAAKQRWQGQVQIGMTDIGGNLDIVSTFRPGEKLLFDLVDSPDQVERLLWQAHDAWWTYFRTCKDLLMPDNPGYSCWTPLFSDTPYYMLQCDFAYMIGPAMFERFVLPELESTARSLDHAFYHLDGTGQLPHLDMLLQTQTICGIQWVPGDGKTPVEAWPEVYQRILDAGKLTQIFSAQTDKPFEVLDILADHLGRCDFIAYMLDIDISEIDQAEKMLSRFGYV